MERIKLIELQVGVTEQGMYCTTYLTPEGTKLADADSEFKTILDAVVASVAKAITDNAPADSEPGKAKSWGPGAVALAQAMNEAGVETEVVGEPGLTVH